MNNTQPIFAFLDENNVVVNIALAEGQYPDGQEDQADELVSSRILCNTPEFLNVNQPSIGYNFRDDLRAFIPPQPDPTWFLNTSTYLWKPDPSIEYDLHEDGKLYRYDPMGVCWIPLFGPS